MISGESNKFEWNAGDIKFLGICHLCAHKFSGRMGCAAFPVEIPDAITQGEFDNRKPFPGDHGIVFKAED